MMGSSEKVYILILSYRNASDTIECLESVDRLAYPNFEVVVYDNASPDGAFEEVRAWARANRAGRIAGVGESATSGWERRGMLHLLQGDANLGYAGGNNAGLRYIDGQRDAEFVWILNNDTTVEPDALTHLAAAAARNPRVGLWGSCVKYYYFRDQTQAFGGGCYNPWWGVSRYCRASTGSASPDYILGASTLVTAEFLEKVGPMSEDYFLYFEELDWAERGRRHGLKVGVCSESVVFHKEGASTGIDRDPTKKSPMADYYVMRNRILFARKFRPWTLPTIYLGVGLSLLLRLKRRQKKNAAAIWQAVRGMLVDGLPKSEIHPVKEF